MKQQIIETIEEMNQTIENFRAIIRAYNEEVLSGKLVPTEYQKELIDYSAQRGRDMLKSVEKLKEMLHTYGI